MEIGLVLVLLGLVIIVLCVWLGDGRAKGAVILGVVAGVLVSTTGLATGFRDWLAGVLTSL